MSGVADEAFKRLANRGGEWNRLFVKQNKMKQGREEEEGEKEKMAKREW